MSKSVNAVFSESICIKECILSSDEPSKLIEISSAIFTAIYAQKKLLICGNGGSAADAQHLAAEMLIRLRPLHNREGVPAISLAQDSSTMTACANDYHFDDLYARMVQTLGNKGDVLLVITTSGNSENIITAVEYAKEMGATVLGLDGFEGGKLSILADYNIHVPSDNYGIVEDIHQSIMHMLAQYIRAIALKKININIDRITF